MLQQKKDERKNFFRLLDVLLSDGQGLAIMVEAYCDESGTHRDAPILCVAGFAAEPQQWKKFCRRWQTVLDEKHLEYFHMKEVKKYSGHVRKHLQRDECEPLIMQMVGIVKKYVSLGVAVSITEKEYQACTTSSFRSKFGSAYSFCAWGVLFYFAHKARQYGNGPLAYFLESGHRNEDQLSQIFHKINQSPESRRDFQIDSCAFLSKKTPPLQAADLLAYSVSTSWQKPEPRELVRMRQTNIDIKHLTPQEIQRVVTVLLTGKEPEQVSSL
jgi:hypothetical protein